MSGGLACTATTSDVLVAELRTFSAMGPSVPVPIAPGATDSPSTVAAGGVALYGLSSGLTTVGATCAPLVPCAPGTCPASTLGAIDVTAG